MIRGVGISFSREDIKYNRYFDFSVYSEESALCYYGTPQHKSISECVMRNEHIYKLSSKSVLKTHQEIQT